MDGRCIEHRRKVGCPGAMSWTLHVGRISESLCKDCLTSIEERCRYLCRLLGGQAHAIGSLLYHNTKLSEQCGSSARHNDELRGCWRQMMDRVREDFGTALDLRQERTSFPAISTCTTNLTVIMSSVKHLLLTIAACFGVHGPPS